MIVTEEEAKTKRCQESFGPAYTTTQGKQAMAVPLESGSYALVSSPSHCIGSACMAWRWAPTPALTADRSTTHGYCGKAGRP